MLNCDGGLKADENWMSTETSWVHFMVLQKVRKIWWATSVQGYEDPGGKFKAYMPFDRKPMELFMKLFT